MIDLWMRLPCTNTHITAAPLLPLLPLLLPFLPPLPPQREHYARLLSRSVGMTVTELARAYPYIDFGVNGMLWREEKRREEGRREEKKQEEKRGEEKTRELEREETTREEEIEETT